MHTFGVHDLLTLLLIGFVSVAMLTDLRSRRIPNVLCVCALTTGLVVQFAFFGLDGLLSGIAGSLVGLAILLPLYMSGGMGAGDVKLLASIGAFLGVSGTLVAGAATLIIGAGVAFMVAAWHQVVLWSISQGWVSSTSATTARLTAIEIPYAVAIGFGTAVTCFLL